MKIKKAVLVLTLIVTFSISASIAHASAIGNIFTKINQLLSPSVNSSLWANAAGAISNGWQSSASSQDVASVAAPNPVPVTAVPITSRVNASSSASAIANLQELLNQNGYSVSVSGTFNKSTVAAVRQFQKASGLKADGSIGPKTITKLNGLLNGSANTNPSASVTANTNTSPTTTPSRVNPALLFHPPTGTEKILFMGGAENENVTVNFNDVYSSSDMQNWNLISPDNKNTTAKWSQRARPSAFYFNNKYWVIGGIQNANSSDTTNDIWSSPDGVNWSLVQNQVPFSDYDQYEVAVFNNKIFVIGGQNVHNPGATQATVWSSPDGVNWTTEIINAPFGNRVGHALAVFNGKMYMIGGFSGFSSAVSNPAETWVSSDGANWTLSNANSPWGPAAYVETIVYNNKLYLLGGAQANNNGVTGTSSSIWSTGDGVTWSLVSQNLPFTDATMSAEADSVVANGKIWLAASAVSSPSQNYLWNTSDGINWTKSSTPLPWSPRYGYSLVSNGGTQSVPVTLDPTLRIAYWTGKVNQHVDAQGNWLTDPDGSSGANLDKLTYCQKWYPSTTSIADYKSETITTWRAGGNGGQYTNTVMTTKCVQGTILTPLDPTPRIAYWLGKVNQHVDSQGNWQTDPDGTSGANLNELAYCQKWYPNTTSVSDNYKSETMTTWHAAGNTGQYTNTVMTTKCVTGSNPPRLTALKPTVDLKVNGSDNPSAVPYKSTITASWTTTNATSCTTYHDYLPGTYNGNSFTWGSGANNYHNISVNGSMSLKAALASNGDLNNLQYYKTLTIGIQCGSSDGTTANDEVTIPVTYSEQPPTIILKGNNPDTSTSDNTHYADPGYTATDPEDGDITSKVTYSDTYVPHGPCQPDEWIRTYTVTDSGGASASAQRTIMAGYTTECNIPIGPGDGVIDGSIQVSSSGTPSIQYTAPSGGNTHGIISMAIPFSVTAFDSAEYISASAIATPYAAIDGALDFCVDNANGACQAYGNAVITYAGNDPLTPTGNNNYLIPPGQAKNFVLQITALANGPASYRGSLLDVDYSSTDALHNSLGWHSFTAGLSAFKTPYIAGQ